MVCTMKAARGDPKPALGAVAAGLLLAGCGGPLSTLDPAGPGAASIAQLWWVMFWGSAVIFLGVMGLLVVAAWKPGALARVPARHWIIHGGVTFTSVIVLFLLVYALAMGERLIARPLAEQPLTVEANGVLWLWEFSYPDTPGAEPSIGTLHIPAGQPVDVAVTSSDVIHSFWVPRLGGKIDAIPGHRNVVRLTADRPGTYRGVCAEFCGVGHAGMDFTVIAHDPEDYEAALREAGRDGGEP
jgi:cytochrome c oxidase subunit II